MCDPCPKEFQSWTPFRSYSAPIENTWNYPWKTTGKWWWKKVYPAPKYVYQMDTIGYDGVQWVNTLPGSFQPTNLTAGEHQLPNSWQVGWFWNHIILSPGRRHSVSHRKRVPCRDGVTRQGLVHVAPPATIVNSKPWVPKQAGWLGKIPSRNGWWEGVPPWLWKPPNWMEHEAFLKDHGSVHQASAPASDPLSSVIWACQMMDAVPMKMMKT